MEKRLQRKSILAVLIAMFLAFSIAGFALMFTHYNNAMAEEEKDPVVTVYLGEGGKNDTANKVYYYEDFVYGWSKVVDYAKEAYATNSTDYVKVILKKDWVAEKDSAEGFNDGLSEDYYLTGSILVPENTNITIDLTGNKIDRNLSIAQTDGQVIVVKGNLTITDSSTNQTGVITGGYNTPSAITSGGGGILVTGGTLNLKGGSIEYNQMGGSTFIGIGVSINGNGTVNMYGGRIAHHANTSNKNSFGGGVGIYASGCFNMYGGVIEENAAVLGGGVACYNVASTTSNPYAINIYGGKICNNTSSIADLSATPSFYGGGGIGSYFQGDVNIEGGEVCQNFADAYGGGIYIASNQAGTRKLDISGGYIHHNVVANLYNNAVKPTALFEGYGGGIALKTTGSVATIKATLDDGIIDSNVVISGYSTGGGISLSGASTFIMNGGSFTNQRIFYLNANALTENAEEGKEGEVFKKVVNAYKNGNAEERAAVEDYITEAEGIGGAVYVSKTATFEMHGGKIGDGSGTMAGGDWVSQGNRAWQGGGVYVLAGKFVMTGGTISYNMSLGGAGVRLAGSGSSYPNAHLSGNPVVKNNIIDYKVGDTYGTTTWDGTKNGYPSDYLIHDAKNHRATIGEFTEGAEIHIVVDENMVVNGGAFTKNYSKDGDGNFTNSKEVTVAGTGEKLTVYANPYNYFSSDLTYPYKGTDYGELTDQHIVAFTGGDYEGELGVYPGRVAFVVEYSDGTKEQYIFGEKFVTDEEKGIFYPAYNYIERDYETSRKPTKITAYKIDADGQIQDEYEDSKKLGEAKEIMGEESQVYEAGIYTLQVRVNNEKNSKGEPLEPAYMAFSILVQSKPFNSDDLAGGTDTEGLKITITGDSGLHYEEGKKHEPAVETIKYNGLTLIIEKDYKVTYENNEEAGENTAYVVIEFINNYSGTIKIPFTIEPSEDSSTTTNVEWQIFKDGAWVALTSENNSRIYDSEVDLSGLIRAKLTYSNESAGNYQTVYSKGYVATDDEKQNSAMWLEYRINGEEAEFGSTGTYTINIIGHTNYQFTEGQDTYSGFSITKFQVTLSADDFGNYADGTGDRLWRLQIGVGESALYGTLLDSITYTLNSQKAPKYEEGTDTFARFRNTDLSLVLNGSYTIGEKDLSYYLDMATVQYYTDIGAEATTLNGTVVGTHGEKITVTTKVVITFDDSNYEVSGGNIITLTKTWYIVTVSNNLRTEKGDDADIYQDGELPGLVFGTGNVLHAFRPEHGNTLIYTYYKNGEIAGQFALVYVPLAGNPYYADKTFYEVKTVDGEWAVDYEKAIIDDGYLYTFNSLLKAGDYTLIVTIPEGEPSTEAHVHWWNRETANDNGTMYYKVEYTFTFTVEVYVLADENNTLSSGIEISYEGLDRFVYYTGETDYVAEPVIILNGDIVLERDVDYKLYVENAHAGWKTLIIEGINSLKGTFNYEEAFEIRAAENSWVEIPSIMRWTYAGFNIDVNVIIGVAKFGNVYFKIALDADGNNVIEGLGHITTDSEGHITDTHVVDILNGLNATTNSYYYLIACVDKDAQYGDYEGITTNPMQFQIFKATNAWERTPAVNAWTEGEFVSVEENLLVKPMFGDAHVKIVGTDGTVYYDSDAGINKLSEAKNGFYTLTAWVEGSDNFSELYEYRFDFEIFKQPGLPWWATLLIAVGALAVAALILFILWKKGVFQILTEKLFVAIKTRASVEATIASVRAAKMMEEGRQSVAEAKRRERLEELRKKAQEEREMSPEERAAKLEAKAQADAAKAEKLRKRSEAAQKRADKMRSQETNSANNNPETPTEE